MFRLADVAKTLLVLGARNLGAAVAVHFAGLGWNVAAGARSDETVASLGERIPEALGIVLDASRPEEVARACEETRSRFGSVDLAVNAVSPGMRSQGAFGGGPLTEATVEDFEHYAVQVLRQCFAFWSACSRAVEPGATLVQLTGGSARRAMPGRGPWAAGAFATRAMSQAAALELRERGIHAALVVIDAVIASPKTEPYTQDAGEDALAAQEDVARAIEYLAAQAPSAWTHELTVTPRGDTWSP